MKIVYISHPSACSAPPAGPQIHQAKIPSLLTTYLSVHLTRERVQVSSEGGVGGMCCC